MSSANKPFNLFSILNVLLFINMDLSKINKNILISLTVVAVSFLILELFSRIFFLISDRDIKAFKKFPGRYIQSYFSGYKLSPNWVLKINRLKKQLILLGLDLLNFNFLKVKIPIVLYVWALLWSMEREK